MYLPTKNDHVPKVAKKAKCLIYFPIHIFEMLCGVCHQCGEDVEKVPYVWYVWLVVSIIYFEKVPYVRYFGYEVSIL